MKLSTPTNKIKEVKVNKTENKEDGISSNNDESDNG